VVGLHKMTIGVENVGWKLFGRKWSRPSLLWM